MKSNYTIREAFESLTERAPGPRNGAQKELSGKLGIPQNTLSGLVSDRRAKKAVTIVLFRILLAAKQMRVLDDLLAKALEIKIINNQ